MTTTKANFMPARSRRRSLCLLLAVACVATLGGASQSLAKIVKEKSDAVDTPREVFGRIARAWDDADERALAALVHADGLRVTDGRSGDRASHYSPSQAYYYFRNLFQSHRTLLFEFEMTQDATAGERVHGMATWKRRRVDSERVQVIKLVCTLGREDGHWRLAEINTIR